METAKVILEMKGEVERIRPQLGDKFIVSMPSQVKRETAVQICGYVAKFLGVSENDVLVVDGSVQITVQNLGETQREEG